MRGWRRSLFALTAPRGCFAVARKPLFCPSAARGGSRPLQADLADVVEVHWIPSAPVSRPGAKRIVPEMREKSSRAPSRSDAAERTNTAVHVPPHFGEWVVGSVGHRTSSPIAGSYSEYRLAQAAAKMFEPARQYQRDLAEVGLRVDRADRSLSRRVARMIRSFGDMMERLSNSFDGDNQAREDFRG